METELNSNREATGMENSKRKKVLWKAKVSELQLISSRFSLINWPNQEMRDKPKQRLKASISSRVPELIQCDRLCPSQFSRIGTPTYLH